MAKRIKYLVIDVKISDHQTQRVTEPEWVLPILGAIHGGARGEPEVIEEVLIDKEAPDATVEYERLSKRYRNVQNDDGSQGISFCAAVYGAFGIGSRALGESIKRSIVDVPEELEAAGGFGDLLGDSPEQVSSVGG